MAELLPGCDVRHPLRQVHLQLVGDDFRDVLGLEEQRDLVDLAHVVHRDDRLGPHLTEHAQLPPLLVAELRVTPAADHVGGEASGAQLLDRVLRRLRLLLVRHRRHQRHLDEEKVIDADLVLQLPQRLDEGHALNVSDGAAELDDAHVRLGAIILGVGAGLDGAARHSLDPIRDRRCDVRHHLDSLAEVLALALLLDDLLVHLARRDVVVRAQGDIEEAFIVAEIQVRLAAVVQHERLAVLEGRHGPRVNVEVRVDFDHRHLPAAALQQHRDRGRRDALPEPRHDPARHHHILHFADGTGAFSARGPRRSGFLRRGGLDIAGSRTLHVFVAVCSWGDTLRCFGHKGRCTCQRDRPIP
mmetsp:Transcript_61132/g.146013  ORF Transcript_61132/g.146013 Transcript_61132/m.146013 type:complete len:357 (+) Transcript_61132:1083-2153(+)